MSKRERIPHTAKFLQTFHTAGMGYAPKASAEAEERSAFQFVTGGASTRQVEKTFIYIKGWKILTGAGLVSEPQAKWIVDIAETKDGVTDEMVKSLAVRLEQGFAKAAGTAFITKYKDLPRRVVVTAAMAEAIAPGASTKEDAKVTEDGIYVDQATGRIFKVQFNRGEGAGNRLYAKQLTIGFERDGVWEDHKEGLLALDFTGVARRANDKPVVENSWEYVRGLIHRIKPEWRLTPEQAISWGALYGSCVRCHRDLTKESSIRQMMGDTCAGKQGF